MLKVLIRWSCYWQPFMNQLAFCHQDLCYRDVLWEMVSSRKLTCFHYYQCCTLVAISQCVSTCMSSWFLRPIFGVSFISCEKEMGMICWSLLLNFVMCDVSLIFFIYLFKCILLLYACQWLQFGNEDCTFDLCYNKLLQSFDRKRRNLFRRSILALSISCDHVTAAFHNCSFLCNFLYTDFFSPFCCKMWDLKMV